jgi:hypothetical protein
VQRAFREIDTDDAPTEVGDVATDVAGGAAADLEDRAGRADGGEAAQAVDVPGFARELVGEVGSVLLGDAVECRPDVLGAQVPTRSVAPRSRSRAMVER